MSQSNTHKLIKHTRILDARELLPVDASFNLLCEADAWQWWQEGDHDADAWQWWQEGNHDGRQHGREPTMVGNHNDNSSATTCDVPPRTQTQANVSWYPQIISDFISCLLIAYDIVTILDQILVVKQGKIYSHG